MIDAHWKSHIIATLPLKVQSPNQIPTTPSPTETVTPEYWPLDHLSPLQRNDSIPRTSRVGNPRTRFGATTVLPDISSLAILPSLVMTFRHVKCVPGFEIDAL